MTEDEPGFSRRARRNRTSTRFSLTKRRAGPWAAKELSCSTSADFCSLLLSVIRKKDFHHRGHREHREERRDNQKAVRKEFSLSLSLLFQFLSFLCVPLCPLWLISHSQC